MFSDRRQHPRFPILLVATAHTPTTTLEVVLTNVSGGGAFLASRQAMSAGAPVEVEVKPHGPDGPTVMLHGLVRNVVAPGGAGQPGFAVAWTEAHCPTSRLALEQVLRDVLRLDRFRVTQDGLGGKFRFGTPFAEAEPLPERAEPASTAYVLPTAASSAVVTPAAPLAADATDDAMAAEAEAALDEEPALAAHAEVELTEAVADAPPEPFAPEPFSPETFDDSAFDDVLLSDALFAAAASVGDDASTNASIDDADEQAPQEEATVELSVALAQRLAAALESDAFAMPEGESDDWATSSLVPPEPVPPEPDLPAPDLPESAPPVFLAEPAQHTETYADFSDDLRAATAAFADAAPAMTGVDFPDVDDWAPPTYDPAMEATAAYPGASADSLRGVPVPLRPRDQAETVEIAVAAVWAHEAAAHAIGAPDEFGAEGTDFGFAESAAPATAEDPDEIPDVLPEVEAPQRFTRTTVMRRLSGAVAPGPVAQPDAPGAVDRATPSGAVKPAPTSPPASTQRPTSGLSRSFLAKVSTTAATSGVTVRPESQPMAPQPIAPTPSAPRPSQPVVPQLSAEPVRPPPRPTAMVEAGVEVPRVMTESTVAYTRESRQIGPLLHAQTTPLEDAWPAGIPTQLAERYGYLEHIGSGGHGVAYRAVDLHLNRTVVLKFLGQSAMSTEMARRYFLREVKLSASLNHPNIVHIYDIGKVDDVLYYAMEYVDGVPLTQYLPPREPIHDWQFLYSVVAQLCDALDHAHGQGILHRDVKPDNVLVAVDGVVKLFDFGLARVADEGFGEQSVLVGTPHYMAPEQLMGGRVDHRADIYALGVMIFQLVTGVLPFQDGNIFAAHAVEPVPDPRLLNPALPAAIVPVIERAMAKQPSQRYGTSRELAHDLYAALFGSPIF